MEGGEVLEDVHSARSRGRLAWLCATLCGCECGVWGRDGEVPPGCSVQFLIESALKAEGCMQDDQEPGHAAHGRQHGDCSVRQW